MKTYAGENTLSAFSNIVKRAIAEGSGGAGGVPVGAIVIWSGTAGNIPTGWALCDGQDGRPDLRDKFVLGAGTAHSVGSTGGSEEVKLTVAQMPAHGHNYTTVLTSSSTNAGSGSNKTYIDRTTTNRTETSGQSAPHPNMPPYYALCYIIKVTADETDGVTMDQVNAAIDAAITGAIEEAY